MVSQFSDFNLSQAMLDALNAKGFTSPTPIQALVIPEFWREKANIIGQAQTGTGKTAAFAIPIIESIKKTGAIKAIVLTPTRELAIQVCEEMYSLIGARDLRISSVYGGASIELQIRNIKRGSDIVVGTPGRVIDLIQRGVIKLSELEFFVLDEADEMLNMGFVEDIEQILQITNKDKNMLFFSATMPTSILQIAKKYMGQYKVLKIENKELTTKLTEQIYFEVRESDKFEALCRVLDFEQGFYGIIFCRTKVEVDDVTRHLQKRGYMSDSLHGDITQAQRNKTLTDFKEKTINVLVATDVAARGIDVNNLTHVINYSIPQEAESYVHRIGRTGRAGNKGIAITFVTSKEMSRLGRIQKMTKTNIKKQELPEVADILRSKEEYLQACLNEIINEQDFVGYSDMANRILASYAPQTIVAALLRYQFQDEFLTQGYAKIEQSAGSVDTVKLCVAMGRKDGISPRYLLDILYHTCKIPGRKVRDIRILDKMSFISVPFNDAEMIVRKLNRDKKIVKIANN